MASCVVEVKMDSAQRDPREMIDEEVRNWM